jgi:hypothetical protein
MLWALEAIPTAAYAASKQGLLDWQRKFDACTGDAFTVAQAQTPERLHTARPANKTSNNKSSSTR